MKLRFIGEDGSMGLKNGEAYDARIYIRGKFLWVEWKVGRFMTRSCPYSSTKAFAQNWGSGRISFAKRQRDMVCRCLVE